MTTDPFTEAAYTSAQEQYPVPAGPRRGGKSLALYQQRAHVEGWEAARTHLAAQEPTDAESIARKNLGDDVVDRLAAHFGVTQEPTDADALAERIAEKIRQALSDGEALQCTRVWEAWRYGTMTEEDFTDAADGPLAEEVAAAVLPTVAEEVRKAKAEALREMQEHHEREADKAQTITARGIHLTIADGARKRATKYETGDSDGHR